MAQQQQLEVLLDKLDTILTISSCVLETENYNPGKKELRFFTDSALKILDEMGEIDLDGGGL